jgi:PKD repeat protein
VAASADGSVSIYDEQPSAGTTLDPDQTQSFSLSIDWSTASEADYASVSVNENEWGEIDKRVSLSGTSGTEDIQLSETIDGSWDQATLSVSVYEEGSSAAADSATVTYGINDGTSDNNDSPVADISCADTYLTTQDTLICDADDSYDSDGSIQEYTWTFQGETYRGTDIDVSDLEAGAYDLKLVVEDDDSATHSTKTAITIEEANEAPTAEIDCGTSTVNVGETVSCDADGSSDPDGFIDVYSWSASESQSDSGERAEFRFDSPGTKNIDLSVTDDGGRSDSASTMVEVVNDRPTAKIYCSETSVSTEETVSCDASGSADSDGSIEDVEWTLASSNELIGVGTTLNHQFSTAGTYTVEVTVSDEYGKADTATMDVTVENPNQLPTAEIDCETQSIVAGESPECSAAGSSDPDGTIDRYIWEDGSGSSIGNGQSLRYTFTEPGTQTVSLTVVDNNGGVDSVSQTIRVQQPNRAPVPDIECESATVEVGESVRCSARGSEDPDGSISSYQWDIQGASTQTGSIMTSQFATSGEYRVQVTVVDSDGDSKSTSQTITVRSAPSPQIQTTVTNPSVQQSFELRAQADSQVQQYQWDLDGDGRFEETGRAVSTRFAESGSHQIRVKATGPDGLSETSSTVVNVQNSANFQLFSDTSQVQEGETVVLQLSANNKVNDRDMEVSLEFDLPSSGVSVVSVAGTQPSSPKSTDFFTVTPGDDRSINIRLQINDPGEYDIGGTAVYYYGEEDARREAQLSTVQIDSSESVNIDDSSASSNSGSSSAGGEGGVQDGDDSGEADEDIESLGTPNEQVTEGTGDGFGIIPVMIAIAVFCMRAIRE